MNFFITKSLWVICIIAFVCADVAFGQFGFESNRGFSAQNMNLNQNRNGFGVFAFGGQSTTSNFNQQNFNEATHFGFFREPGSEMNQIDNGRGQFSQPAQPQPQPAQPQPQPTQQVPAQQFPQQPTQPQQSPQAQLRESEPMQLRYASPYDMPTYIPKRPAHAYASHSYPLPSPPAPQVHCPSNLLISCKLQVQDAPCEPTSNYGQY